MKSLTLLEYRDSEASMEVCSLASAPTQPVTYLGCDHLWCQHVAHSWLQVDEHGARMHSGLPAVNVVTVSGVTVHQYLAICQICCCCFCCCQHA